VKHTGRLKLRNAGRVKLKNTGCRGKLMNNDWVKRILEGLRRNN
jgi:hypothetical protein